MGSARQRRPVLSPAVLYRLAEAQNWRCCWCGFRMLPRKPVASDVAALVPTGGRRDLRSLVIRLRTVTAEHVVPRCDEGTDDPDNLAAACNWCNAYRGNQPPHVAGPRIEARVRRGTHPFQVWDRQRTLYRGASLPTRVSAPEVSHA